MGLELFSTYKTKIKAVNDRGISHVFIVDVLRIACRFQEIDVYVLWKG